MDDLARKAILQKALRRWYIQCLKDQLTPLEQEQELEEVLVGLFAMMAEDDEMDT